GGEHALAGVFDLTAHVGAAIDTAGLGLHGEETHLDQLFERQVESVGIGVQILGFTQPTACNRVGSDIFDIDRPAIDGGRNNRVGAALVVAARVAPQSAAGE